MVVVITQPVAYYDRFQFQLSWKNRTLGPGEDQFEEADRFVLQRFVLQRFP